MILFTFSSQMRTLVVLAILCVAAVSADYYPKLGYPYGRGIGYGYGGIIGHGSYYGGRGFFPGQY